MSLSVLMTYGKTIYMITYLVSLESEISYLFNTNKYQNGEDTPMHIPVEIHMSTVLCKCIIVCFPTFDKFSKHLEKVFHVQIFLPTCLVKISFSPKDFKCD